jgi:hypothetical protein
MKFRSIAACGRLRQRAGRTGQFMLDRTEQPSECVGFDPSGRMRQTV